MTRRTADNDTTSVPLGSLGRRSLAVMASLLVLATPSLPSLHIHFHSSSFEGLTSVVVHQHVTPHRVTAHQHASLSDDDDDGTVQTLGQHWLARHSGCRLAALEIVSFETWRGPDVDRGARVWTFATTSPPSDPLPRTDSLRAPPSIT